MSKRGDRNGIEGITGRKNMGCMAGFLSGIYKLRLFKDKERERSYRYSKNLPQRAVRHSFHDVVNGRGDTFLHNSQTPEHRRHSLDSNGRDWDIGYPKFGCNTTYPTSENISTTDVATEARHKFLAEQNRDYQDSLQCRKEDAGYFSNEYMSFVPLEHVSTGNDKSVCGERQSKKSSYKIVYHKSTSCNEGALNLGYSSRNKREKKHSAYDETMFEDQNSRPKSTSCSEAPIPIHSLDKLPENSSTAKDLSSDPRLTRLPSQKRCLPDVVARLMGIEIVPESDHMKEIESALGEQESWRPKSCQAKLSRSKSCSVLLDGNGDARTFSLNEDDDLQGFNFSDSNRVPTASSLVSRNQKKDVEIANVKRQEATYGVEQTKGNTIENAKKDGKVLYSDEHAPMLHNRADSHPSMNVKGHEKRNKISSRIDFFNGCQQRNYPKENDFPPKRGHRRSQCSITCLVTDFESLCSPERDQKHTKITKYSLESSTTQGKEASNMNGSSLTDEGMDDLESYMTPSNHKGKEPEEQEDSVHAEDKKKDGNRLSPVSVFDLSSSNESSPPTDERFSTISPVNLMELDEQSNPIFIKDLEDTKTFLRLESYLKTNEMSESCGNGQSPDMGNLCVTEESSVINTLHEEDEVLQPIKETKGSDIAVPEDSDSYSPSKDMAISDLNYPKRELLTVCFCTSNSSMFFYVLDLLRVSNFFKKEEAVFYSKDSPMNPYLYSAVEITHKGEASEAHSFEECGLQVHAKLIFDLVNQILYKLLSPFKQALTSKQIAKKDMPIGEKLAKLVWRELRDTFKAPSMNPHDYLYKMILIDLRDLSWKSDSYDVSKVVRDLERMVFRGLVEELIIDLTSP